MWLIQPSQQEKWKRKALVISNAVTKQWVNISLLNLFHNVEDMCNLQTDE